MFSRLGTWVAPFSLSWPKLGQSTPKDMMKVPHGYRTHTKKNQGQGQVTKGHDNQRSPLSRDTIFRVIKVYGGIRSIVRSHFLGR